MSLYGPTEIEISINHDKVSSLDREDMWIIYVFQYMYGWVMWSYTCASRDG